MTQFDESKIARAADGKFAPNQSGEADAGMLGGGSVVRAGDVVDGQVVTEVIDLDEGVTRYWAGESGGVALSPQRQAGMGVLGHPKSTYPGDETALVMLRYPEAFCVDPDDEWGVEDVQWRAEQQVSKRFPEAYDVYRRL